MTNRIEIRDLYKIFGSHPQEALKLVREGKSKAEILDEASAVLGVNNVSLSIPKGSISVIMGLSGSGKSTLAALLGERGWRLMGDEFALLDLDSGAILPFPRLVSLKNQAIGVVKDVVGAQRMGPMLQATAKGDIRHLVPRPDAVARMAQGAMPAMLLFPRFGHDAAIRPVGQGEAFMRLTQASTNYVALGEPGFAALTRFVTDVPACAMDFPSGEVAFDMIDRLWEDGA